MDNHPPPAFSASAIRVRLDQDSSQKRRLARLPTIAAMPALAMVAPQRTGPALAVVRLMAERPAHSLGE